MAEKNYELKDYVYESLKGRQLFMPARKKSDKTFLLIYGQHVSIERLLPMVQFLSNYGSVYLVDNPGFGNMQPSYKIGQKPSLDFYDGHLKQVFDEVLPDNQKITVVGISLGFQIITHFLQAYPEYTNRVKEVVSFVGFVKYSEMHLPKELKWLFKYVLAGFGQTWPGYILNRYFLFQPILLTPLHFALSPLNKKMNGKGLKVRWRHAKEQAWLWKYNDPRTHAYTGWQIITKTDLTKLRIDLTSYHIHVEDDQYIDNKLVIKNLGLIYSQVMPFKLDIPNHSPVDIEDEYKIAELVPKELVKILET